MIYISMLSHERITGIFLFVIFFNPLKSMIMKRFIVTGMFLILGLMFVSGISPYIKVAEQEGPMQEVVGKVKTVLEEGGYKIIGQY